MDRLLQRGGLRRHETQTHGTLLLVDDDAMNRDALSRRLMRTGYTVLTAESGADALEHGQRATASTRCCST